MSMHENGFQKYKQQMTKLEVEGWVQARVTPLSLVPPFSVIIELKSSLLSKCQWKTYYRPGNINLLSTIPHWVHQPPLVGDAAECEIALFSFPLACTGVEGLLCRASQWWSCWCLCLWKQHSMQIYCKCHTVDLFVAATVKVAIFVYWQSL